MAKTEPDNKAQLENKHTERNSQWYVYLLRCADTTLYAGVTTDCKRRVREHNGEIKGGAKYTRVRRPVELVWSEQCEDRSSACKREAQVKKMSRSQKAEMVKKSRES